MSLTNRLELGRLRFGASRVCWGDARARWRGSEAVTERRRIGWGQGLLYCQVSPRCDISVVAGGNVAMYRSSWLCDRVCEKDASPHKRGLCKAQGRCDGVFAAAAAAAAGGGRAFQVGWRGQPAERQMDSGTI